MWGGGGGGRCGGRGSSGCAREETVRVGGGHARVPANLVVVYVCKSSDRPV